MFTLAGRQILTPCLGPKTETPGSFPPRVL
jgi:hypothetical protein